MSGISILPPQPFPVTQGGSDIDLPAFLLLCHQVMAEDLVPEKMKEDNQDGESLDALCNVDFDERWYDKLKRRLS